MGKLFLLLTIAFSFGYSTLSAQSKTNGSSIERAKLNSKIEVFSKEINNYLENTSQKSLVQQYLITDEDLDFWIKQFVFTEEVLQKMSKQEFYNQLESWAIEAKLNLEQNLKGADYIEIASSYLEFSEDPSMRVNKSATLTLHIFKGGEIINVIQATLIDLQGKLKLIQAN